MSSQSPCAPGAYNWEIAAHRHDGLLQMLYLQSGEGEVLLDNQRVEVKAPCLLFIPEQIVHGFAWHGRVEGHVITAVQHPLESIVQVLSPGLLPQIQKPCVVALPHWAPADDPLEPLYRALYGEYHGRGREHIACSMSLLLALVIQMLRLSEYSHDLHAHRHDRRSQQVVAFRELVNRHFREHLSLHDYAGFLGVTVVTLGRAVPRTTRHDPHDPDQRPADPRSQTRAGPFGPKREADCPWHGLFRCRLLQPLFSQARPVQPE